MSGRKLFVHELEQRLDELLLLSLRRRSPRELAQHLESLPRELQERILHWAAVATQTSGDLGWVIASIAAERAPLVADGLDDWVRIGLDAYDRHGLAAARRVLNESADAMQRRKEETAVEFVAVEGRLSRFLQALHGRPLRLASGEAAWTDSETLWLPDRLAGSGDADRLQRLYKVLATLLWAQARFGSFNVDPEPEFALWDDQARATGWFALFEAMRLESRLQVELPGLAREIATLRGPWPEDLAAAADDLARPEATAADSLRWVAAQRRQGARHAPEFTHVGRMDPLAARRVRAARIAHETKVLRRALQLMAATDSRPGADADDGWPLLQSNIDVAGFDAEADLALLPPEARAAAQSLVQDLGELPREALHAAGPGAWAPVGEVDEKPVTGCTTPPDAIYDEWDYRRGAMRRGWCHLYELEGPSGDAEWVADTRARHAHRIRSIRRRFEAMRGEDKPQRRQYEGEEIDLDSQVEARADRRAGSEPSPRLFVHRRRIERSLAVMFMVDMSGSTKGWINDAERESLVLLCEAIEALGDAYAIYGFSGWTRTHCDIYRVKRFDDAYDEATRRRIAGIEARDYTRMGVAVRHLGGLLLRQPARHKLLVTLSDGRPDDYGDEYRGRYGIEDTRRALLEAREQGIRSYCVTIDRHGADYLPQLYGPAQYTVLEDARLLPQKLAEIYRKLTA